MQTIIWRRSLQMYRLQCTSPRRSGTAMILHSSIRMLRKRYVLSRICCLVISILMRNVHQALDGAVSAPDAHVYSRLSAPNCNRLESILSDLLHGHALTYTSGLSAFHALLAFLNPKHIAMGDGYHGCHGVVGIISRLSGLKKIDLHDPSKWDEAGLGKGDVIHVETPLNPTGEAYNLEYYAAEAHKRGAYLTVDATFGPPGLQDPFKHGADAVMHSGTKYIGGHSDMLCGVLAVSRPDWWRSLYVDRVFLGSVMGSFEGWLGLRSLRTLELRVQRQSQNAEKLVRSIDSALRAPIGTKTEAVRADETNTAEVEILQKGVLKLQHASLQTGDMSWLLKQMPNGFGPVFALWMKTPEMAKRLPSKLSLFQHATSLGGVESLIEWRRMSDEKIDERVLRVSVGAEDWADLREDLVEGVRKVVEELS